MKILVIFLSLYLLFTSIGEVQAQDPEIAQSKQVSTGIQLVNQVDDSDDDWDDEEDDDWDDDESDDDDDEE